MKNIFIILILIAFGYTLFFVFSGAIDENIDQQNRMLCQSASISGNLEYLKKCKTYYETGDVTSLRYNSPK